MELPDPSYVKTADGAYIAYAVVGDGPVDIAWQFDFFGNIDMEWDEPFGNAWYPGLASFARVILHDRRATGLSSRNVPVPNLETRVADLRAVLDAAGSERTVIGSWYEGLAPGILLAATEPDRVRGLVWWNPSPRTVWGPDYPWGSGPEEVARELAALEHWGTRGYAEFWAEQFATENGVRPSDAEVRWIAKESRNCCTPDVAIELNEVWWQTDVRGVLSSVQVPTLLLVDGNSTTNREIADHVASLMPRADIRVLPWEGWPSERAALERNCAPWHEAIREFVGVKSPRRALDTVLSTVLFTDIVGSTETQAKLGDRGWKDLVERHHAVVRSGLDRWRGVENDTAGDGFYATFDGPARAIHCAVEVAENVRELGIEIRAGVHTGECELIDGKAGGIAVTTGARISALAGSSEILISQTVKDLVAGSGLSFEDAGEHDLKGVPDRWRLYRVVS
ncbi:MAG TPA: adenylate/guanylate cyclase domain-containing protein [Actinomycetota bacterium]|nr:adenylate/guanylate cyclase domain-containing protein [Actinomycetota bacterium]